MTALPSNANASSLVIPDTQHLPSPLYFVRQYSLSWIRYSVPLRAALSKAVTHLSCWRIPTSADLLLPEGTLGAILTSTRFIWQDNHGRKHENLLWLTLSTTLPCVCSVVTDVPLSNGSNALLILGSVEIEIEHVNVGFYSDVDGSRRILGFDVLLHILLYAVERGLQLRIEEIEESYPLLIKHGTFKTRRASSLYVVGKPGPWWVTPSCFGFFDLHFPRRFDVREDLRHMVLSKG
ncbi:hypothetical protein Hypma_012770 [Hypsizygus marmoreus]|uniref:Uncharacterized protein n=1 Tax=Hypsizygus marmoreus TaxID=39966 RepID=A0A369JCT9_HYPMA|nr:hypothetical protein Hypma_012770 [Hypsizygus marmoreus]